MKYISTRRLNAIYLAFWSLGIAVGIEIMLNSPFETYGRGIVVVALLLVVSCAWYLTYGPKHADQGFDIFTIPAKRLITSDKLIVLMYNPAGTRFHSEGDYCIYEVHSGEYASFLSKENAEDSFAYIKDEATYEHVFGLQPPVSA